MKYTSISESEYDKLPDAEQANYIYCKHCDMFHLRTKKTTRGIDNEIHHSNSGADTFSDTDIHKANNRIL